MVDEGNGKFKLMIMWWGEGNGKEIKDKDNDKWLMKVMKGKIKEVKLNWNDDKNVVKKSDEKGNDKKVMEEK